MDDFAGLWFNSENVETETSDEQCECELLCSKFLMPFDQYSASALNKLKDRYGLANEDNEICLLKEAHAEFLERGLHGLPGGFVSLDASKPWICYWITHSLYLLNAEPHLLYPRMISTLAHMQVSLEEF